MSDEISIDRPEDERKPRIALLGEFSAGKSTLANALMEQERSPMRVTATHVPPVWYSFGDGPPVRVTRDGEEIELEDDDLSAVPLDETEHVRVYLEADILRLCDLIDMPGSSDPNMAPDIWDRLLPQADGVIWCTAASQAWRQSEAAIWEDVPEKLYQHSLLLLTRIDKVRSQEDRARVHARISREVAGKFRGVFPVSLLEALAAKDDADIWRQTGMAAFSDAFLEIVEEIEKGGAVGGSLSAMPRPEKAEAPDAAMESDADPETAEEPAEAAAPSGPVIMPRRVTRMGGRSSRPRRTGSESSLL